MRLDLLDFLAAFVSLGAGWFLGSWCESRRRTHKLREFTRSCRDYEKDLSK